MNSESNHKAWPQYLASASAGLAMVSSGTVTGWTSPTMALLLGDESPVPMTYGDFAWIAATVAVGVSSAAIFTASTIDRIGRKPLIIMSAVFYIVSWLCIIFAKNLTLFSVSKFFAGFAIGSSLGSIMIYIGETVEPKRRGSLGILIILCSSFGVIFESILGSRVSFTTLNGISLIFPILFLLSFSFMPESPHFLVSKGMNDQAYTSLMWLRGQTELKAVKNEMDGIIIYVHSSKKLNFLETVKEMCYKKNRKALVLISIVFFGSQFSGTVAINAFTERIFVQINSPINPPDAVIILNALSLLFVLSAMFIIDKVGRKILLIVSLLGCTLSHAIIATYLLLSQNGTIGTESAWVAMVGLFSFIALYSVGLASVPRILLSEIFPKETKAWFNCLVTLYQCLMGFVIIKFFQILEEGIGAYASFFTFAISLFVTLIFVVAFMPETKNKSLNEIQEILQGKSYSVKKNIK